MNRSILLIPLTCVLISALGCNEVHPPIEGRADPFQRQQIHLDSGELRHDTTIGQPIVVPNESGLLNVTVPIRSDIDQTLYVDWRVTFFDHTGTPIENYGPFTKTLLPHVPDQVQFNSTSTRAADFQIDFSYAR
ncbi:MAG TPA: hypothetical protein VH518_24230 [Tepidisphaeraceae bacterium]|jgi:hypothetical protein